MPSCPCCRWAAILFAGIILASTSVLLPSLPRAGEAPKTSAGDWPTFGGSSARNMVNPAAKNAPVKWQIEEGLKNVRWQAQLGKEHAYGTPPVIAGGRVFVGTDNGKPRDPKVKGPKAVIMCFAEKDGKFLWQAVHDMPPRPPVKDATGVGQCAPPTVEGDRLYYFTPAAVLVCADVKNGKANWQLDMMKELKVWPNEVSVSAPLVVGDLVYVLTGNGVDATSGEIPSPEAPSFVAVQKKDGKVKWKSNLPGKNIFEGQWSNPSYAEVNGKGQVIFPGGDCWLYGLEADTGQLLWKFHCNPVKEEKDNKKRGIPNYLLSTPVVYKGKVYIGVGLYPQSPTGNKIGHFWCVDLARAVANGKKNKDHDVSPRNDNFDPKAPVNKDSALGWHYGGELVPRPKFGRMAVFGRTFTTAAIHDGLVYITEEFGFLHCLDADTGKPNWLHDFKTGVQTSPFWADGKVYVGTDDSEMFIFAHGKKEKVIAQIEMGGQIQGGAVIVADGTMFVATANKLYAIGGGKK
jgi:outer membrane protein assembly factor BamB